MIDEWGSEGAFAIKRPKKSFSHETFQIGESLGYTLKGGRLFRNLNQRGEITHHRGSSTVQLTYCLFCLHSAALLV